MQAAQTHVRVLFKRPKWPKLPHLGFWRKVALALGVIVWIIHSWLFKGQMPEIIRFIASIVLTIYPTLILRWLLPRRQLLLYVFIVFIVSFATTPWCLPVLLAGGVTEQAAEWAIVLLHFVTNAVIPVCWYYETTKKPPTAT